MSNVYLFQLTRSSMIIKPLINPKRLKFATRAISH